MHSLIMNTCSSFILSNIRAAFKNKIHQRNIFFLNATLEKIIELNCPAALNSVNSGV